MKLKTLPLLLLLTALPTLTLSAQNSGESPPARNNDYGIDAGKLYAGTLVLELLREAEAEIDAAAREGYEAGYKAALLAEAPNAAYYKTLSENLKRELDSAKKRLGKDRIIFGFAGTAVGAIGMSVIYFINK
jgi:hypothetical protein